MKSIHLSQSCLQPFYRLENYCIFHLSLFIHVNLFFPLFFPYIFVLHVFVWLRCTAKRNVTNVCSLIIKDVPTFVLNSPRTNVLAYVLHFVLGRLYIPVQNPVLMEVCHACTDLPENCLASIFSQALAVVGASHLRRLANEITQGRPRAVFRHMVHPVRCAKAMKEHQLRYISCIRYRCLTILRHG